MTSVGDKRSISEGVWNNIEKIKTSSVYDCTVEDVELHSRRLNLFHFFGDEHETNQNVYKCTLLPMRCKYTVFTKDR
jgi:hypothetical protein